MTLPVCFVVGPTGVGKTASAVRLAQAINAEIICMDSMQVYQGMDIGTGKPTREQRRLVKHHLIDIILPNETFDVSRYQNLALQTVHAIRNVEKEIVFCGGTGLYMKSLLDGLCEGCPKDPDVRDALESEVNDNGLAVLYERLRQVDPDAAAHINPHDKKRIIRALEVYMLTGTPLSVFQKTGQHATPFDYMIIGLTMDRAHLYSRIDERVTQMFDAGLLDEYRTLIQRYGDHMPTACYAVGYKELQQYCDGRITLAEAKSLIQQNTRNYAKRQLTWFRADKRILWFDVETFSVDEIVQQIIAKIG